MLNQQPHSGDKVDQSVDLPSQQLQRRQLQRESVSPRYWTEQLPEPPTFDTQAAVQDDLRSLALLAAVRQLADQNNNTTKQQLNIWLVGDTDEC